MNPVKMPIPWDLVAFILFAVCFAGYAIYQLLRSGTRPQYDHGELVGDVGTCEIRLIRDKAGHPMVGIVWLDENMDLYTALNSSNALLLAGWLRLAAARGKTLAEARMNLRKHGAG